MAYYFFVPGGKRRKEDWDAVRAIVEAHGQQTGALALSDPKHSSLSEHISEVCDQIGEAKTQEVCLTGHSYASFVITGVANAMPAKIAKLIYVDSLIPENGKSLFDFFNLAGVDTRKYGIPPWPPFTEPLFFDQATLNKIPKRYIHCIHSQFLEMTRGITQYVQEHATQDHWDYFDLDSDHYCMLKNPAELARVILLP